MGVNSSCMCVQRLWEREVRSKEGRCRTFKSTGDKSTGDMCKGAFMVHGEAKDKFVTKCEVGGSSIQDP